MEYCEERKVLPSGTLEKIEEEKQLIIDEKSNELGHVLIFSDSVTIYNESFFTINKNGKYTRYHIDYPSSEMIRINEFVSTIKAIFNRVVDYYSIKLILINGRYIFEVSDMKESFIYLEFSLTEDTKEVYMKVWKSMANFINNGGKK